jgi:hypothetical protein
MMITMMIAMLLLFNDESLTCHDRGALRVATLVHGLSRNNNKDIMM